MGMSIEESINGIKKRILPIFDNDADHKALETAIETMYKYQKIKEIIADWESDGGAFEMSEPYWLRLISEVVEDGNDD